MNENTVEAQQLFAKLTDVAFQIATKLQSALDENERLRKIEQATRAYLANPTSDMLTAMVRAVALVDRKLDPPCKQSGQRT